MKRGRAELWLKLNLGQMQNALPHKNVIQEILRVSSEIGVKIDVTRVRKLWQKFA